MFFLLNETLFRFPDLSLSYEVFRVGVPGTIVIQRVRANIVFTFFSICNVVYYAVRVWFIAIWYFLIGHDTLQVMVCHFQRIMCHFERTRIYPRKAETHHHHWNELGFSSLGWLNTLGIRLGLTWTGRPGGHGLLTPSFLPGCLGHLYFPVWGKNSTESTKVSVSVAFKPRD